MTSIVYANKTKRANGFTLIEFSMVMVISGFLLVAALEAYTTYIRQERITEISDNIETIKSSLSNYKAGQGRYPCPADADIPMSDPKSGLEDCTLYDDATYGIGECLHGICKVGGRDTDGDGNPDPVLVGAIPYRTIKAGSEQKLSSALCYTKDTGTLIACDANNDGVLDGDYRVLSVVNYQSNTEVTSLDPWGYKLTYAVTEAQSDPDIGNPAATPAKVFRSAVGAISIETPTGISIIKPAGSAHYVVISHGENHKGAYSKDGNLEVPCTAGTYDYKNCDGDATFVDGIRSMADNTSYYDDTIGYSVYSLSTIWDFTSDGSINIYNLNMGNVGVNTADPTEKLDVSGHLRADYAYQTSICDESGANCWDPTFIADQSTCPTPVSSSQIILATGIRGGGLYCNAANVINKPSGFQGKSCPAGQFLQGIDTTGTLHCAAPPP